MTQYLKYCNEVAGNSRSCKTKNEFIINRDIQ